MNLRRPVDRGYVVNWDLQREIWDHVFAKVLKINPKNCHLVLLEPPFNLPNIMWEQDVVVFERFQFKSALICNPATRALHRVFAADGGGGGGGEGEGSSSLHAKARCGVVVDAGFSFTHATPVFDGKPIRRGIKRLNLGGKALTNYLKELVSYRQWNMMDEQFVLEDVKEKTCYAAADVCEELKKAKMRGPSNEVNREYILPDGVHVLRGSVKEGPTRDPDAESSDDDDPDEGGGARKRKKKSGGGGGKGGKRPSVANGGGGKGGYVEQLLAIGNERFMVPEALFHPTDIGLDQAGIAELTTQAVNEANKDLRGMLYGNIVLTGGCALIPGFKEKFEAQLRPLVNADDDVRVVVADGDPICAAWRGASDLGASDEFDRLALTREDWKRDQADIRRRYDEHVAVGKGRA